MLNTIEPQFSSNSRLLEAQDENTSPERLTEIYNDCQNDDDGIKQALILNPNTPVEILIKLSEYYPTEFLGNPALDLYLLANPNLLAEMPIDSLLSILRLPQAPPEFILFALNHRRIAQILVIISSTHTEIWQEWLKNNDNIFQSANFSKANLSGANLKGVNLRGANLRGANLEDTDLEDANLKDADLWDANLKNVNLKGANLEGAVFWYGFNDSFWKKIIYF